MENCFGWTHYGDNCLQFSQRVKSKIILTYPFWDTILDRAHTLNQMIFLKLSFLLQSWNTLIHAKLISGRKFCPGLDRTMHTGNSTFSVCKKTNMRMIIMKASLVLMMMITRTVMMVQMMMVALHRTRTNSTFASARPPSRTNR